MEMWLTDEEVLGIMLLWSEGILRSTPGPRKAATNCDEQAENIVRMLEDLDSDMAERWIMHQIELVERKKCLEQESCEPRKKKRRVE